MQCDDGDLRRNAVACTQPLLIDATALGVYLNTLDLDGIVERTRRRVEADVAADQSAATTEARERYWRGVRVGAEITREWLRDYVRRHAAQRGREDT